MPEKIQNSIKTMLNQRRLDDELIQPLQNNNDHNDNDINNGPILTINNFDDDYQQHRTIMFGYYQTQSVGDMLDFDI